MHRPEKASKVAAALGVKAWPTAQEALAHCDVFLTWLLNKDVDIQVPHAARIRRWSSPPCACTCVHVRTGPQRPCRARRAEELQQSLGGAHHCHTQAGKTLWAFSCSRLAFTMND
jgi:hypothetical protein